MDTNKTPTCAVLMHAPQTNALWWGEEGSTTKARLYALPRRVGDVEGRAVLSEHWGEAQQYAPDRLFIAKTEMATVQWCGRGVGMEVWLHARVLWGCESRCEILAGHGAGSNEHEDKESRRCRAPIKGFATALWDVLDSKFYILYMLHILIAILLVPSLCTIFNILLLVFYLLCPRSYMLYSILCILYLLYQYCILCTFYIYAMS